MPEKMNREMKEKIQEVDEVRQILETSKGAILADYRGLNVKSLNTLRKRLRDNGGSFRVVKNTLYRRASEGMPASVLGEGLEGPTGMAYSDRDAVELAKILTVFAKESKILKIKGGVAEGHVMDPAQLAVLATLPPREYLLAQVVGGMQAPVSAFVGTMQQLYAGFVYTLQGVAEKKGA